MTEWKPSRLRHRWFARVADLVDRFACATDWPSIASLNACFADELSRVGVRLVEVTKAKPRFRSREPIDPASLYEVRIAETGEIPSRPHNAHDLMNALVWAAFPRAKLALTRALATVQRERATGRTSLPNARTPLHDQLALLDEGALLCNRGAQWIFGHAIYEHAYAGRFDVRGCAVELDVRDADGLSLAAARNAGCQRGAIDRAFAGVDFTRVVRTGAGVAVG